MSRRIVLGLALVLAAGRSGAARSARELLDHVDDLFRGRSSHGRATMVVTTAHWARTLSLEFWSQGKEKSLIRILEPQKEKGTATLKVGNDIWNWLPKVKRVIKLPSSMMSASWMGSHFTNDDLVKESRMADDYTSEITFEGVRDGRKVIEITATPKPDAPVVWGKLLVVVDADSELPLRVDFYDEDLELARTIRYSDVKELGGRKLPTRLEVVPADKPGESTVVVYDQITFDVPLDDSVFSLQNLQR
jgi:outer membrane lipoprotein-sorting protein